MSSPPASLPTATQSKALDAEQLAQIVDYLKAQGLDVASIKAAISEIGRRALAEDEWYCSTHKRTFKMAEKCPGCSGLDPGLGTGIFGGA